MDLLKLSILIMLLCAASAGTAAVKPSIGVYYFPGWYRGTPGCDELHQDSEWRNCVMKCPHPRALCGFSDDSSPRLWDYYTEWMSGCGIDFIAFDWYYNAGQLYLNDSLDRGFLGSPGNTKLKFALHWCNHGGGWWQKPLDQSRPALMSMIDLACDRYFKRPNYLRIDGKPVFMIYDTDILLQFGGIEQAKANLRAMRGRAISHGLPGLYIVGVYSGVSAARVDLMRDLGYDAFCAYTYVGMRHPSVRWDSRNIPYETGVANTTESIFPFLSRIGREDAIPYWPSTFSGWDDRPRAGAQRAFVTAGTTGPLFEKMLRGAMGHVNEKSPVVMVEAWNEWGEGACIEPSVEHGFGYLDAIAKVTGHKLSPKTPSAQEISSWSVLTADELVAAKNNESIPWDPPPFVRAAQAKSYPAKPVRMPLVLDLAEGGAQVQISGCELEKRDSEGALLRSTGTDPSVSLELPNVPTEQVKRILLEGQYLDGSTFSPEVFFRTGLYPEFSSFCWFNLPPFSDGRSSLDTGRIMPWQKAGTPLTGIRVDFAEKPDARFLMKRIVLE